MTELKGHFDGHVIVLDEPATLEVGQEVKVIVTLTLTRPRRNQIDSFIGFAKGQITMRADFNDPLDDFAEYQ